MYESMLLESGKMFKGSRVSGIGADVVDDTETIFIPVHIPEGLAVIVEVNVPSTFTSGVAFDISATIRNDGYEDDLFIRFTNIDTGSVFAEADLHLIGGATEDWGVNLTLVQFTDFHLLIEVGHVENGVDVVDDSSTILIPVLIPEGIAEIVSVTAPDTFTPGVSFTIGVMIKNVGTYVDRMFARITNIDTGEVLGAKSLDLNAGETSMPIPFPINLPQETDFNGLIEAGHIED